MTATNVDDDSCRKTDQLIGGVDPLSPLGPCLGPSRAELGVYVDFLRLDEGPLKLLSATFRAPVEAVFPLCCPVEEYK